MRNTIYYGFRMDKETYELIKKVARSRGIDLADLFRELVKRELARLSFLSEEEKKALGINNDRKR